MVASGLGLPSLATTAHASAAGNTSAPPSSANTSLLTIVRAQIVFLLSTLSEDNWAKNRDEIRSLIDEHGPDTQSHFIRRLVLACAPLLTPQDPSSPNSVASPIQANNGAPQPNLVLRLLASEVQRLSRDPASAEKFRDAIANPDDHAIKSFSLIVLFSQPTMRDVSPLERLVFVTPFLTLLIPAIDRAQFRLGAEAATLVRSTLSAALDQLGKPATTPSDLADLSPLALSKLFSVLLSDNSLDDASADTFSPVLEEGQQKAVVVAAVQGRLGPEVGSQVLAHCISSIRLRPSTMAHPIRLLLRLCPRPELVTLDLIRSVITVCGALGDAERKDGGGAEMRVAAMMFDLVGVDDQELTSAILPVWTEAIAQVQPALRWGDVLRAYDNPMRELPEEHHFQPLLALLRSRPSHNEQGTLPIAGLWQPWTNPHLQLGLIERVLHLSSISDLAWGDFPAVHQALSNADASALPSGLKSMADGLVASPWNCVELISTLLMLGETAGTSSEAGRRARALVEQGCRSHPELFLFAMVQDEKHASEFHRPLAERLLSVFLSGQPNHQFVFHRLLQLDRDWLIVALRNYYGESEMNVTRILDIAQDLSILDHLLTLQPFFFSLDLASLASRREYINLERWLATSIDEKGSSFVRGALEFVGHKAKHDLHRQEAESNEEPTTVSLSVTVVAMFMRALRAHHELFTGNDVELFKEVRTQCLQLYPRLMNFSPRHADSEPGVSIVSFPTEIESECDALYKRMYDQEVSVDSVVSALQRARKSDNQHDHQFLACFLHGLFDEHRFFHTYPPNELSLTASLFGDLIQYQLLDFVPLGIAVRYVLDALRNPPNTNRYRFGIQALARFQSRLSEWPQLAHSIRSIPHIHDSDPAVAEAAERALQQEPAGGMPGDQEEATALLELPTPPEVPVFTAIQIQRQGPSDPQAPDEEITDKILFIVNNLAPSNFDTKVEEMAKWIEPAHFAWFAHYLVAQRVSIEPNNHALYHQFLSALVLPDLAQGILYETYVKLDTLLNSEKTVQSSTERTLLKNLGSWLGGLTLAKDKPIKQRNIAFKQLLVQGYDSHRLIVAIPFVCKVLEQCAKSRVFKPPNPWLMAIIRLLVELYQFAELKLNLKFEIEVLCKSLNIDLKEVEPTDILRSRPKELPLSALASIAAPEAEEAVPPLSRSFAPPSGHVLGGGDHAQVPSLLLGGNQPGYSLSLQDTISSALQALPNQIVFNPQLSLFSSNPNLKRLIFVAIDRAVREIIAPVVERSVTIAGISTRELTKKDFAMEGDESKLVAAAHRMVQNLAGSLALVTCKEPLRISMVTHIRNLLLQNGFTGQTVPEQAVLVVAADNLELACSVVEKVAMDKAVLEVDDGLASAYLSRRTHRERSRDSFWDTAAMAASHYSGMLPDPLRLKLGGLQPSQLKVYEDFADVRILQDVRASRAGINHESPAPVDARLPSVVDEQLPQPAELTGAQTIEKFNSQIGELESLLASDASTSLGSLSPDSALHQAIRQLPLIASTSSNLDEVALGCSQKVVQLLYRSETGLAREVFVVLLERFCSLSVKVTKEVTAWLLYAEDERKFNVPVTIALVYARLLDLADLDSQLAKLVLRDYRSSVVDFTAQFARELLLGPNPRAAREQIAGILEALSQASRYGKGTEGSRQLLTELRGETFAAAPSAAAAATEDDSVRDQLTFCFAEWVRLFQQSYAVEKSFVDFVVQLQNQGILKGEEISSLFFRVCVEVSVEGYIKHKAAGGTSATGIFQPVDAFAKLVVFMIKYHADPTGVNNDKAKVHYMTKVLSIVVLVLADAHEELGPHFQQKPFFRFFSSLLSNLNAIEGHLGSAYHPILIALSHSINTLQPSFFPGFAFSWLGLISHRLFMPKLLSMRERDGWTSYQRQLVSLLRFLAPFLRKPELSPTTRALYMGTQRIFLVLLHDFPDFLAQAAFALCDAIPPSSIQLQNLVLSAFPIASANRLPDPLQAGLRIELLPDINKSPQILADYTASLSASELRSPLDKYLQDRSPASLPPNILRKIKHAPIISSQDSPHHNVPLANSLALYLGVVALSQSKLKTGGIHFDPSAVAPQLLRQLVEESEVEARYYLIGAVANHLRYPNAHTYWFSEFLLHLFDSTAEATVKEQIVRVLLERIVVSRPHAWGVLYTFSRLLTDPSYRLMDHKFVTAGEPAISSLFRQIQARTVTAI